MIEKIKIQDNNCYVTHSLKNNLIASVANHNVTNAILTYVLKNG